MRCSKFTKNANCEPFETITPNTFSGVSLRYKPRFCVQKVPGEHFGRGVNFPSAALIAEASAQPAVKMMLYFVTAPLHLPTRHFIAICNAPCSITVVYWKI